MKIVSCRLFQQIDKDLNLMKLGQLFQVFMLRLQKLLKLYYGFCFLVKFVFHTIPFIQSATQPFLVSSRNALWGGALRDDT